MNLQKSINEYLDYCINQKALNQNTIKAYKTDLLQYASFSNSKFSNDCVKIYISHLHKSLKPKSVKRKIATLKAFTHYLIIHDVIATNPFDKIATSFREPTVLPKTIPLNIISAILSKAYSDKEECKTHHSIKCITRDIAILELLFATGARVSEICHLTPDAIDLNEHTLKIMGKGAKERIILIENPDVLKALEVYNNVFSLEITSTGYFFVNKLNSRLSEQSVRAIINKYTAAVGYDRHVTPHMFRHSFATLLLEEDVDIRYIQKILGHSSITTTQIYTHVAMAKQKEILSIKHPRNKLMI